MRLLFTPLTGPAEWRTPNGPGTLPLAARSTRIVAGHPEAFLEAFANIYSDAAEAIAARPLGLLPTRWPSTSPTPSTVPSVSVSSKRSSPRARLAAPGPTPQGGPNNTPGRDRSWSCQACSLAGECPYGQPHVWAT